MVPVPMAVLTGTPPLFPGTKADTCAVVAPVVGVSPGKNSLAELFWVDTARADRVPGVRDQIWLVGSGTATRPIRIRRHRFVQCGPLRRNRRRFEERSYARIIKGSCIRQRGTSHHQKSKPRQWRRMNRSRYPGSDHRPHSRRRLPPGRHSRDSASGPQY